MALLLSTAALSPLQAQATEWAGDVLMRAMPIGTLGVTLADGDEDGAGRFLLGFALNAGVTEGLKLVVHKERPDGSDGESFPSGHTSIAFQSATFIHRWYGWEYGVPALATAAFVGYSRVHARKHFLEDVAVGAALGVLSALVTTRNHDREEYVSAASTVVGITFGGGQSPRWRWGMAGPGR